MSKNCRLMCASLQFTYRVAKSGVVPLVLLLWNTSWRSIRLWKWTKRPKTSTRGLWSDWLRRALSNRWFAVEYMNISCFIYTVSQKPSLSCLLYPQLKGKGFSGSFAIGKVSKHSLSCLNVLFSWRYMRLNIFLMVCHNYLIFHFVNVMLLCRSRLHLQGRRRH